MGARPAAGGRPATAGACPEGPAGSEPRGTRPAARIRGVRTEQVLHGRGVSLRGLENESSSEEEEEEGRDDERPPTTSFDAIRRP